MDARTLLMIFKWMGYAALALAIIAAGCVVALVYFLEGLLR